VRRDANAVVANSQSEGAAVLSEADLDCSSGRRVLDGISDQVFDYAPEPVRIAIDNERSRIHCERYRVPIRGTIQHSRNRLDDRTKVDTVQVQGQRSLFDGLGVRQGSDQRRRTGSGDLDPSEKSAQIDFRDRGVLPRELNRALDDAQRRCEIVCDCCDKPIKLLAGDTFAVRSVERACLGDPKTINQPADDDRNREEETEVDGISYARDCGTPYRLAKQDVVSHPASDCGGDSWPTASDDGQANDNDDHEVLEDKCGQGHFSPENRNRERNSHSNRVHQCPLANRQQARLCQLH